MHAAIFSGEEFLLDHVVFDEASQLKLEDNLPAMLKGKISLLQGMNIRCRLPIISAKFLTEQLKMKMRLNQKQVITYKNSC
jgi:hypothetical protein